MLINENSLSFTTTAMPRPEIVKTTYESFTKNLQGFDFKKSTLYLNVDSYPDKIDDYKRNEVVDIAKHYFGNVVVNLPETPSFPAAVKWCFSKVETFYNFHLEDDWELLTPFSVSSFSTFFNHPHVQQVALRAWRRTKSYFWLSPSFLRGSFCREMAEKMNIYNNPEAQIRALKNKYKRKSFLYFPFDMQMVVLKDLGRGWIRNQKYYRGRNFNQWSIREEGKIIPEMSDQNEQISFERLNSNPNLFPQTNPTQNIKHINRKRRRI